MVSITPLVLGKEMKRGGGGREKVYLYTLRHGDKKEQQTHETRKKIPRRPERNKATKHN